MKSSADAEKLDSMHPSVPVARSPVGSQDLRLCSMRLRNDYQVLASLKVEGGLERPKRVHGESEGQTCFCLSP